MKPMPKAEPTPQAERWARFSGGVTSAMKALAGTSTAPGSRHGPADEQPRRWWGEAHQEVVER